jgi:hypothetical protein
LTLATGFAAQAAEYCVSCVSPDVSYRCEVGGPDAKADPRGWLLCITELARTGGHESCSVERNAAPPCPGVHKVLAAPEGPPVEAPPVEAAVPPPDPPPKLPNDAAAVEKAGANKKGPRTVEELASDTYDASKDGLKKAGESVSSSAQKAGEAVTDTAKSAGEKIGEAGSAVGGAAKKTWDCLKSLFQDC